MSRLADRGDFNPLRGEAYPVMRALGSAPLFDVDRGAATTLGILNRSFHLNGLVGNGSEARMWVATRSKTKILSPGKLDNIVAGGHPSGLSAEENLIKECAEEAGIDEALALAAQPVSAITYCMEADEGLRRHVVFAYDLDLPETFEPVAVDGEVERFTLHHVDEVAEIVRTDPDAFMFDCNLVVIDWLLRTGRITPDHPDYLDIAVGLRSPSLRRFCGRARTSSWVSPASRKDRTRSGAAWPIVHLRRP